MNHPPDNARPPRRHALVSVVAPVFNEAGVLAELHARITRALVSCGVRHELVLVNDGSRDLSPQILDDLAARDPHVRVVHLSRNFGHQAAVHAGLAHARGDAVVLMDSDLQDDPAAIPRFLQQWLAGYDVVYAVRTDRKEGAARRLLFAGFYRLLRAVATTDMPLDAGIFGLMDARVVRELLALAERDRFLPGLRCWVGFRQTGVEVERLARYDEQPRVSLAGLCRLAKTAFFSFSAFPLALFALLGYGALAVFVLLAAYALGCKLLSDLAIPGWTSHVLSASFFGALNALGISVLGEYVIRIYDQVRGRPIFLVDRVAEQRRASSPAADEPYEELLSAAQSALAASGSATDPGSGVARPEPAARKLSPAARPLGPGGAEVNSQGR